MSGAAHCRAACRRLALDRRRRAELRLDAGDLLVLHPFE